MEAFWLHAVLLFFYGGSIPDAVAAGLGAVLIWGLQQYLRPVCMNEVTFQFVAFFFLQAVQSVD